MKNFRGRDFESQVLGLYCQGLIAYLEHDLESLNLVERTFRLRTRVADELRAASPGDLAHALVQLRLECRQLSVTPESLARVEQLMPRHPQWKGEAHFVLGNAFAVLDDHPRSRDESLRAAQELKAAGSRRKAVRALLNALASESTVRPKKRYIPDLQFIYSEAKRVQDWASVGTVLANLAHEYRKLGALNPALKMAERSIALQARRNPGKVDHHFALLNAAHILIDLKRVREARALLEEIESSDFAEVQAGLKVLRERYPRLFKARGATPRSVVLNALIPTWRERRQGKALPRLSVGEENLIELLSRRPLPLETLLDKLYGDKIDFDCRKNRFYNLLNRIKKKHVGLIHNRGGVYGLKERPVFGPSEKVSL